MVGQVAVPEKDAYFFCVNLRGTTFDVVNYSFSQNNTTQHGLEVVLISEKSDIDPQEVIGHAASLNILKNDNLRPYDGVVGNFSCIKKTANSTTYKAILLLGNKKEYIHI